MQHDLCLIGWQILLITLTPVVAGRISENIALSVECCRCDGLTYTRISLQPMFCVSIPEVECAVTSCSGECAVFRMEGDSVDAVDIANVLVVRWCVPVAFEAEVHARILLFNVLHGAPAFNASYREAVCLLEA